MLILEKVVLPYRFQFPQGSQESPHSPLPTPSQGSPSQPPDPSCQGSGDRPDRNPNIRFSHLRAQISQILSQVFSRCWGSFWHSLTLGAKLNLGFGLMMLLTGLMMVHSCSRSVEVAQALEHIRTVEVPMALESRLDQALVQSRDRLITAQRETWAIGSVTLLLGVFLAAILRHQIITPIQHLTQQTARMIEGDWERDWETQMRVESSDEVGILAQTLNTMTAYLQQTNQVLQDKNWELQSTLWDLRQAQAQLIHTEKMSSLGQMVAGIAHEINNPANFILGNLKYANAYTQELLKLIHLYQQRYPDPDPLLATTLAELDLAFVEEDLPKLLSSMKTGAERIEGIVKSLRNFSRLDEADLKFADIHEGIDNTLVVLGNRLRAEGNRPPIQVEREYDTLPLVECYPGELNQVVLNLLMNAIDALERDDRPRHTGRITIRTQQLPDTSRVRIEITDNGPGIPDSIQGRLFDPFFTTKAVGQGTGLGLAISHQIIVERHNGTLQCFSQEGQGATFRIEIPLLLQPTFSRFFRQTED